MEGPARRGVSKIVSITLLILISLAVGIATYSFTKGYVGGYVGSERVSGRIASLAVEQGVWEGDLVLFVSNDGDTPVTLDHAYIGWGDNLKLTDSNLPVTIPPHGARTVIVSTAGLPPGKYVVKLTGPQGYVSSQVTVSGRTVMDYIGLVTPSATIDSPLKPAFGWLAKYYNISGLPTVPSVKEVLSLGKSRLMAVRVVPKIAFSTNAGEASSWNLPQTVRFAAVYTSTLMLSTKSEVTISVRCDDGAYVEVDGKTLINAWRLQGETPYSGSITLPPGKHTILVAYFQNYGAAVLIVSVSVRPVTAGNAFSIEGITGRYFNTTNYNPTHPNVDSVLSNSLPQFYEDSESAIDYSDHSLSGFKPWPFEKSFRNVDHFAAHWVVLVDVKVSGYYAVSAGSDDGIEILLDHKVILSDWTLHPLRHYSRTVYLSKGLHRFDIAYYENTGYAIAYFNLRFLESAQVIQSVWKATVYDLSNYGDWGDLSKLLNDVLSGTLPVVGRYTVTYIDYSNSAAYGGNPWFFSGHSTINFATLFTTTLHVKTYTTLTISVATDDGTAVFVDGSEVLNAWKLQSTHRYFADVPLGPGNHVIKVAYFQHLGVARLKVSLVTSPQLCAGSGDEFVLIINDFKVLPKAFKLTLIGDDGRVLASSKVVLSGSPPLIIELKVKGSELPTYGAVTLWG